MATVDTGNVTLPGVAISEEFFRRVGLQYSSNLPKKVGTASRNQDMLQVGVTRIFAIQLLRDKHRFLTKAVVLKGLTEGMNLGTCFFRRIGA